MARATKKGSLPKSIEVSHTRAPDYKQFHADGSFVRLEGQSVIITHYINDPVIQYETMQLIDTGGASAIYRPTDVVEDARRRTDVCAIKIPLQVFQETIEVFQRQLTSAGPSPTKKAE